MCLPCTYEDLSWIPGISSQHWVWHPTSVIPVLGGGDKDVIVEGMVILKQNVNQCSEDPAA